VFRPASHWLVVRRRSSISRSVAASPQLSELVVCGGRLLIVLRSSRPTASPQRTSSQPSNISFKRTAAPPPNSSVRWHVKLLGTFTQCSTALLVVLGIAACNSVPTIDGSSDAAFDRSHAHLVESISSQDRLRLSLAELIVLAPLGCLSTNPIPGRPFLTKNLGGQASIRCCRKELDGLTFKDIISRAYPE
jgi:hypothetical protein